MSKKKRKPRTSSSPSWMVAGCIGKHGKESFDSWRERGFISKITPSEVRRVDPITGEVSNIDILEIEATRMIRNADMTKKTKKAKRDALNNSRRNHRPAEAEKDRFYATWEWRQLRMEVIKQYGNVCQCCGAKPGMKDASGKAVRICVDHIKPISRFWHLRLDRTNLQILCDECNQGKGNWDETDFRPVEAADEFEDSPVDPAILAQSDRLWNREASMTATISHHSETEVEA